MPGDFGEVLSKFRWAQQHLALLNEAVSGYVDLRPYVAVVEYQPGAEAYKVVAHLREPPPAAIAHVIGDVLNGLHGTLDYLAWQLVLREGGTPNHRTAFPLVEKPNADGSEPPVNILGADQSGRRTAPQISDPGVLALLRSVQPYHLPQRERDVSPLVVLRELNRQAKHRHPAIVAAAIYDGLYVYPTDQPFGLPVGGGPVAMLTANLTPLKDGDEMAWVPAASVPDGGLPEHDEFTTFVALEMVPAHPRTGDPLPAADLLRDIAIAIDRRILAPFSALFS